MERANTERRTEVLAAAERLFSQRGYHATSVRDIAHELGIKAGSLYAHVRAKEDLLWELARAAADRFLAAAEPVVRSADLPIEKLRRVIGAHVRTVADHCDSAVIFTTHWRHLTEPRRAEFAATRQTYEQIVGTLVAECVRDGSFADLDEPLATAVILSAAARVGQEPPSEEGRLPEETARRLTDILFHGLYRQGDQPSVAS